MESVLGLRPELRQKSPFLYQFLKHYVTLFYKGTGKVYISRWRGMERTDDMKRKVEQEIWFIQEDRNFRAVGAIGG